MNCVPLPARLLRPFVVLLLAASAWAQPTGPRVGPLPGGENSGGVGVWVLPRLAAFNSPNYSYGGISLMNADGGVFDAPRYAWVRVDNHLALFYDGIFIGADLDFFVATTTSGDTVAADMTVVGTWERAD